jgi:2-succinyl-5-enolpyruvyl-6-hydroxy-3-cyclohexene-1-carboxylate synthase
MPTSDHHAAAELARLCAAKGVKHAVISPGSRSAPLVIAFNKQEGIECLQVIDERSAAFFALGMAQQLHAPVALICTSGSAVLNYGPAIAEAFYQRIPLLVITADRPEEWVDQGEGQAIRQQGVLALHMKRSVQLPRITSDELARWHCGRLINEAIDTTLLPVPGPVHVNVPFAEPLYGTTEEISTSRFIAPVMTEAFVLPDHARWLIGQLSACRKVMVLAGQGVWSEGLRKQLIQLAALPQVTIHTEATSNLDETAFITCIDRAIEGVKRAQRGRPASGPADHLRWCRGEQTDQDLVAQVETRAALEHRCGPTPPRYLPEPHARHRREPGDLLRPDSPAAVGSPIRGRASTARPGAWWTSSTRGKHNRMVADAPFCDLTVFNTLNDRIPGDSDCAPRQQHPGPLRATLRSRTRHRWYGNRGTSGIDGCTSTAVGAAHDHGPAHHVDHR